MVSVGDLVSYRHDETDTMRGIVLYVRKKYINSGPSERAMVHWTPADDFCNGVVMDWVDDLELISETR